ncbi:MAG: quinone-dependent dihydroorotate dehydrogenase [Stellaceae bacterium]
MPDLYPLIRPVLHRLPRELAHEASVRALGAGLGRIWSGAAASRSGPKHLGQHIWGLDFPNPVGLAAGFDKDARVPDAALRLGFGFIEVGTVTPRPQPGNTKPRLFRLDEDRAVINRMGFNSGGLDAVVARLSRRRPGGIVGVNLGKNRDSADAATDYAEGIRRVAGLADYLVVNISSPNTPGLRELQARPVLAVLLERLIEARDKTGRQPPLLLKIAPDLTSNECGDIAEVALGTGIDGLIIANTTIERPPGLVSRHAGETGGLSGRPLFARSTAVLADIHRQTRGRLPLIGVGGVARAEDAYAKICAGASLVQLYTALVFEGPALIRRVGDGLAALLHRDGFSSVAEAVGTGLTPPRPPAANRSAAQRAAPL